MSEHLGKLFCVGNVEFVAEEDCGEHDNVSKDRKPPNDKSDSCDSVVFSKDKELAEDKETNDFEKGPFGDAALEEASTNLEDES